jgi:N-methylhydantoinase A
MLGADIEHTHLKTVLVNLGGLARADLMAIVRELSDEILARLARDGYAGADVQLVWQADLRHEGQATELTVNFDPDAPQAAMRDAFLAEYAKTYGYRDDSAIELVKIRLIGRGVRKLRLEFATMATAVRPAAQTSGGRLVSFGRGQEFIEVPVLSRHNIGSAARKGPLVIEEFDATIVVPPDAVVSVDAVGNAVVELGGPA